MSNNKKEFKSDVFVLSDGSEFKLNKDYDGKYLAVLVQRIYLDEKHKDKSTYMSDKIKNMPDRKVAKVVNLYSRETGERYQAEDTYLIAVNKDYKEYDTVDYYESACINTTLNQKFEVILQAEEWRKRVFIDWSGNMTLADFMDDIGERLWDEFLENPDSFRGVSFEEDEDSRYDGYFSLLMGTKDGDVDWIEFYSPDELAAAVVSVRVVEFESKIIDSK